MKTIFRVSGVVFLISFIYSCEDKPKLPSVTTTAVTEISYTTATSGGNVTNEGGEAVIAKGICYGTSADPVITNSKTTESGGLGSFTSNIAQLTPNTLYYVRAYATSNVGTGYGNQVTFTTLKIETATLSTSPISSITQTTALSGGNITADNGGAVSARGVCWSTTINPTTTSNKTSNGAGTGSFTSNLAGLLPGTAYYVRSYAINSAGTSYGNEINFTTNQATAPVLSTTSVSSIKETSAISGGDISSDGGATVTARGVCWSTAQNPTIADIKTSDGTGAGIFTSSITGLTQGTTYFLRAYATNNIGTSYGTEVTFKTSTPPVYITIYEVERNGPETSLTTMNWCYYMEHTTADKELLYINGGYSGGYAGYNAYLYKSYDWDLFELTFDRNDEVKVEVISGTVSGLWAMSLELVMHMTTSSGGETPLSPGRPTISGNTYTWSVFYGGAEKLKHGYLMVSMPNDLINTGSYNYRLKVTITRY